MPSDNAPVKANEIRLTGGRYDGSVLPVPARALTEAVALLLAPRGSREPTAELAITFDDFEAEIYYAEDFTGANASLAEIEDESLYYPCRDGLWRPLKAKRALGL